MSSPCSDNSVESCIYDLRYFAETLIKNINDGHVRITCDPGYPMCIVRLLHIANRIESAISSHNRITRAEIESRNKETK